jgi:preprotein translocase subunit YajC
MSWYDPLNKRHMSKRALMSRQARQQKQTNERLDRIRRSRNFKAGDAVTTLDGRRAMVVAIDQGGNVEVEFSSGRKLKFEPFVLTKSS